MDSTEFLTRVWQKELGNHENVKLRHLWNHETYETMKPSNLWNHETYETMKLMKP